MCQTVCRANRWGVETGKSKARKEAEANTNNAGETGTHRSKEILEMNKMVALAKRIATKAHRGQKRKWGGLRYIVHPEAVANAVNGADPKTVAWVHDCPEDTDVMLDDLRMVFPERIVAAVDCLTKREGEKYTDFVLRALDNPIARIVKIADIEHNMSTIPEGHGLRDRWEKALKVLKGHDGR